MKLAIDLHTTDFRGDHAAAIVRAVEPINGETVEQLVARAALGGPSMQEGRGDYIAIRLIEIRNPATTDEPF